MESERPFSSEDRVGSTFVFSAVMLWEKDDNRTYPPPRRNPGDIQ